MRFVGTALVAGTIGVFFLLADGGWMRAGMEGATNVVTAPTSKNARCVEAGHFRRFLGMKVENVDGEELGRIKDLVLKRRTGQVRYVIVKSDGFIGRRRLVLVPASAIALSTAKAGIASVDISKRQWKKAPQFRKENLALLSKPEQAESVSRFYDKNEAPRSGQGLEFEAPRLTSTGREPDQAVSPGGNNELELASDVFGKN